MYSFPRIHLQEQAGKSTPSRPSGLGIAAWLRVDSAARLCLQSSYARVEKCSERFECLPAFATDIG